MTGWRRLWCGLGFLIGFVSGVALTAASAGLPRESRIHADTKAVERAAIGVTEALLREDAVAAKAALDALEELNRRTTVEDGEVLGRDVVNADKAFHHTLNLAREAAARGDITETFDMNVWIQRSCLHCHGLARQGGLLGPPAVGTVGGEGRSKGKGKGRDRGKGRDKR